MALKNKRLQIIAATTVFAVLLWLSVNMSGEYLMTVEVPLMIENIPTGLALKAPLPREVQLRFRGDGWQLASLAWRSDLSLRPDGSKLDGGQRIITIREVAGQINIPPGTELTAIIPESLYLVPDTKAWKKVPVVFQGTLSFADGYGLGGRPVIEPDSIIISGAQSVLHSIDSWRTKRASFEQLKVSVETKLALDDSTPYHLSFSHSSVVVRVLAQPFAEKTFSGVAVEVRGVPPDREIILIPPRIEIVVRGSIERLSAFRIEDCSAECSFEHVADTTRYLSPSVTLPEGLQLIGKHPERVQYIIRRRL